MTHTDLTNDPVIPNLWRLALALEANCDASDGDAQIEKAISRRIYKDTDCGAWLARARVHVRDARIPYTAHLTRGVGHVYVTSVRKEHGRTATCMAGVPADVRAWLELEDGSNRTRIPVEVFEQLGPDREYNLERVTVVSAGVKIVRFHVKRPQYRPGVRVGSIVEGTDAEITADAIAFPFRLSVLQRALEWVEGEVQMVWDDTHGCDTCCKHWGDGSRRVWEGCPDCGGDGAII